MKQPYEQGKRMNLLHGLYDEQMGQQVPGVYSYAEIGRMIGRSISAVKLADDEERLIAGRYRILPDPILEEWDKARLKILHYCRKNKGGGTVGQTDIGAVHRCLRPGQRDQGSVVETSQGQEAAGAGRCERILT